MPKTRIACACATLAALLCPVPALADYAVKLLNEVPSASSASFKSNFNPAMTVDTHHDRIPYAMAAPSSFSLMIRKGNEVALAGSVDYTKYLQADNFLLIEITSPSSTQRFVFGPDAPVSYQGSRLQPLPARENRLDLSGAVPACVPVMITVTPYDYGVVGSASDVYLTVRTGSGPNPPAPGTIEECGPAEMAAASQNPGEMPQPSPTWPRRFAPGGGLPGFPDLRPPQMPGAPPREMLRERPREMQQSIGVAPPILAPPPSQSPAPAPAPQAPAAPEQKSSDTKALLSLLGGVRSLYAGQSNFKGLENRLMITANAVPRDAFTIDPSVGEISTPSLGPIEVQESPDISGFKISMTGISRESCQVLLREFPIITGYGETTWLIGRTSVPTGPEARLVLQECENLQTPGGGLHLFWQPSRPLSAH